MTPEEAYRRGQEDMRRRIIKRFSGHVVNSLTLPPVAREIRRIKVRDLDRTTAGFNEPPSTPQDDAQPVE